MPDTDPRVILVRKVGEKLITTFKDAEKDKPWKFSFDVVDEESVNAFALPGGPTFVFTGLLSKMKTEDELAAVLGHELTHVRREHWAYQYADSTKRNAAMTLLLLVFKANDNAANLANIGNEVLFDLKFSRKHETEADEYGLQSMTTAGYNPEGMADTFRLLASLGEKGAPPEFLSDHPNDKHRIENIESKIKTLTGPFPAMRPLDPSITVLPRDEQKRKDDEAKKAAEKKRKEDEKKSEVPKAST